MTTRWQIAATGTELIETPEITRVVAVIGTETETVKAGPLQIEIITEIAVVAMNRKDREAGNEVVLESETIVAVVEAVRHQRSAQGSPVVGASAHDRHPHAARQDTRAAEGREVVQLGPHLPVGTAEALGSIHRRVMAKCRS